MSIMTKQNPHSTFEDLDVYQVAREFRKVMYRAAKRLPDIEKFGLAGAASRLPRTSTRTGPARLPKLTGLPASPLELSNWEAARGPPGAIQGR